MKRILMFSNHPLFCQGVEALLHQKIDFVGRESDVEQAIASIKFYQPDIVIVDYESGVGTQSPLLLRILNEGLSTKIIGLNLQTNTMCIYHGEQRLAQNVQDLVHAIEHDSSDPELSRNVEKINQGRSENLESEGRTEKLVETIDRLSEKKSASQSA